MKKIVRPKEFAIYARWLKENNVPFKIKQTPMQKLPNGEYQYGIEIEHEVVTEEIYKFTEED